MSARDELAELLASEIPNDIYACTRVWEAWSYGTMSADDFVPANEESDLLAEVADAILVAGYRKIFDGDCGLSNVKEPTEREAAEAWMRWANLVSTGDGEPNGIAAMRQMLTEFGYRKPRTITTAEELDALADGTAVLDYEHDVSTKHDGKWHGYEMNPLDSRKFKAYGPFTILWEPEATP